MYTPKWPPAVVDGMGTLQLVGAAVFALATLSFGIRAARDDLPRSGGTAAVVALLGAGAYIGMDAGMAELQYGLWLAALLAIGFQLWWLSTANVAWLAASAGPLGLAAVVAAVAGLAGAPPAVGAPAAGTATPEVLPTAVAAALLVVGLAVVFTRLSSAAGRLSGDVAAHFSVLRNVAALVVVAFASLWLAIALEFVGGDPLPLAYLVIELVAVVAFNGLLLRDPALLRG